MTDHARLVQDHRYRSVHQRYETMHLVIDFLAGVLFTVGSVLFFWKSTEFIAIWCFVIGSVFFTAKPTIKLAREFHLARLPDETF